MKRYIAGNWKMNMDKNSALKLVERIEKTLTQEKVPEGTRVMVAPPFVYLSLLAERLSGTKIILAAQNSASEKAGAFTGEVSPVMLADLGVQEVILGHSERRQLFAENDELINRKLLLALELGLDVLLCVGETLEEREANALEAVLDRQLSVGLRSVDGSAMQNITIAYEPVWAIGTGKTATPEIANVAQEYLRTKIADIYGMRIANEMRLLYGGSVNESNATALLEQRHIDGALIGGASLKADAFCSIIKGN